MSLLLLLLHAAGKQRENIPVMGLTLVTDSGLYAGNCSGGACGVCVGQGSLHQGHATADMARMVRSDPLFN